MDKIKEFMEKMKADWKKTEPFRTKAGEIIGKICRVCSIIGRWIYRLRTVLLSIPVAIGAIRLALYNQQNLPEMVGIDLQATGEYAMLIERNVAVMGPLAVTAGCLLLMFCSRRVLYPWIISLFSLVLPVLILLTNMYPA